MAGLEISLPGGGTKNSKTGKITPPKPKKMPAPTQMTPSQYDALLRKVIADMQKKNKKK
jgi:hypothetical protein